MAIIKVGNKATAPSVRPSLLLDFANTKQLDPRVAFTRSTTATYYDGKTSVISDQNLIKYSQDLTNSYWASDRLVRTTGELAPDGTNTAIKCTQSSSTTMGGYISNPTFMYFSGDTYTWSGYFKFVSGGSNQWIKLDERSENGTVKGTWFDIANGTIGETDPDHTATIHSVSDGWYRCSITFVAGTNAANFVGFYLEGSDASTSAVAGADGVYAWGLQLELRDSTTHYVPTTTVPVTRYQSVLKRAGVNVPRFDHDPLTNESKGLLIEGSETNLIYYSEVLGISSWQRNLFGNWRIASRNTDYSIAPDGTHTATCVSFDDTIEMLTQRKAVSNASETNYTFSIWIKKIAMSNNGQIYLSYADSTDGSSLGNYSNENVTDQLIDNEWVRVSRTVAVPSTATAIEVGVTNHYGLSGSSSRREFLIWGAQLETRSHASSYIKTESAQTSRGTDLANINLSTNDLMSMDDSGITLYTQVGDTSRIRAGNGYPRLFEIFDNQYGAYYHNFFSIYGQIANSDKWRFRVDGNTLDSQVLNDYQGKLIEDNDKVAVRLKENDFALVVDGNTPYTDSSMSMPILNKITLGAEGNNTNNLDTTLKKFALYPTGLSNDELIAITED
jgi:hypothetical protein